MIRVHWLLRQFVRAYRISQWHRRRFTPAGRALGYLLIAAAAFGLDTQRTTAFQIFALAAALLLVAWLASLRARPRLAIERRLPAFATAGEPVRYRQVVRNIGSRPLPGLHVRDELADDFPSAEEFRRQRSGPEPGVNWVDRCIGYPRWLALAQRRRGAITDEAGLPGLLPQCTAEVVMTLTPSRRGALTFVSSRVLRADPLGLVNAVSTLNAPGRLVVLPRRYPLPSLTLPGARRFQRGGVSLSQSVGDSQEFTALREYRPGDPVRHIHWRSFARFGEPVVKEFQDEFFTRYALVLDTFADELPDGAFEAAVSVAASFVDGMHTQDALLDLMFVEDRAWRLTIGRGLGQQSDLLRELAFVQQRPSDQFPRLAQHVLLHGPALSACVLVLLRLDEERRSLLRALTAAGVHLLVLVVNASQATSTDAMTLFCAIDPADIPGSLARLAPAA